MFASRLRPASDENEWRYQHGGLIDYARISANVVAAVIPDISV